MIGNEDKKRGYKILVGTIVDAFNMEDHINPEFKKRRNELREEYRGRYFESDFIYQMYVLRQSVPFIDPLFRQELHMIVDRAFESNLKALRAVVAVEKEMLAAEGELIHLELETRMKATELRLMERSELAFKDLCRKFEATVAEVFENAASPTISNDQKHTEEYQVISDNVELDSAVDAAMTAFSRSTNETRETLVKEFELGIGRRELPVIERLQTCRRHMQRVMDAVKSMAMDI